MNKKYYSAKEAAEITGLSKSRIKKAIVSYNIGIKIGNQYALTDQDIEVIESRKGKTGRGNWIKGAVK